MTSLRNAALAFLRDPAARTEPAPFYQRLLVEAPMLDLERSWLVSGYDEIAALAVSPALGVDPAALGLTVPFSPVPELSQVMSTMLPVRDGADHARLKALTAATFSARGVAALRAACDRVVAELLAEPLRTGAFDLVADLAVPLPVRLSCALLGLPAADEEQVIGWATEFARNLSRFDLSPADLSRFAGDVGDMLAFVDRVCEDRRRRPGNDLISVLVAAQERGGISRLELHGYVVMLFANGLDTLTSGIAVAVWELLGRPDLLARIATDPTLAEPVFNECVRLGSPVRATSRIVTADTTLGAHRLRRGQAVVLLFAAANRDPRRFAEPDTIRLDRTGRHLGFGRGPHHCLGAALSLLAGSGVVAALARHGISATGGAPRWKSSLAINGLDSLPLAIGPARLAA